jgi:hypothetical protein
MPYEDPARRVCEQRGDEEGVTEKAKYACTLPPKG